MPLLRRPLTDTVARPLRAAVIWGMVVGGSGLVVALGVGAIGYAITWIGSLIGDTAASWPRTAVFGTAIVGAFASLAASTWAAAYASAGQPVARSVAAGLTGALLFAGGIVVGSPVSLAVALVVAWSLAIPFERWTRLAARVVPAAAIVGVVGLLTLEPAAPIAGLVAAVTYPLVAVMIGLCDRGWRALAWRRSPQASAQG